MAAKKNIATTTLSPEDLEAMLETAIQRANAPLTVATAAKALPAGVKPKTEELKSCLDKLVEAKRAYAWQPNKFWRVEAEAFAKEQIVQTLSSGPLAEAEIKKKVPATIKTLVKPILAALVKQGKVKAHPKLGKIAPFGLKPADAADYLAIEIEAAFAKLRKLGFKAGELEPALRRHAGHQPITRDGLGDGDGDGDGDGEAILAAMLRLNAQASRGALVYIKDLRAALDQRFRDKHAFDRAVLDLAREEKIQLQSHAWPARLSDSEKEALIANGRDGFFDAIGIRLE